MQDTSNNSEQPSGHASPLQEETFVLPASLEQNRYWMLAQIDPDSTAANMAISFELEGLVDDQLAERTIAALTLRHEVLRTIFRLVDGQLSQVILARPLYRFATSDLSAVGESDLEKAIADELDRHSHVKVDLHNGPLLHARLIHISARRHILAFTMSHIVCDGWSNGILVRDFGRIYQAERSGREADLPELPFQFADFSAWQAEYLQSERAAAALAFWTQHISRDLPAVDLPTDAPRTAGRSFPGQIESQLITPELNQLLTSYCRTTGSTKHIVLLAAFQGLCARYTGQLKFLLGSTIANRTQPGMEDVVGRFANPQIVIADVQGDPTFQQLEERVRDWETTAYTHQDLPFSRIIEAFQMNQAAASSQFLQVWFVYQKAFMQPQESPGLKIVPRRSVSGGVDFDMLVSVVERAEGPRIQVEYNTLLFSPERVRTFIRTYHHLLEQALKSPRTAISALGLEPPATAAPKALNTEPRQIASNRLQLADALAGLRQNAGHHPGSLAVASTVTDVRLSWQQLVASGNALATRLRELRIGQESAVVLQMAPSPQTALAALASLLVGAKVTPVSGQVDTVQLNRAAEMCGASVVFATQSLLGTHPSGIAFESILVAPGTGSRDREEVPQPLATEWLSIHAGDDAELHLSAVPLARTLTSASELAGLLGVASPDAILSFASADASDTWLELLLAFYRGCSITLGSSGSMTGLQSVLDRDQISAIFAAQSDWRQLHLGGWSGDRRLAAVVRDRFPATVDHSFLASITRQAWRVLVHPAQGAVAAGAISPDGETPLRALGNRGLAVMDGSGRPVLAGAVGELLLEGTIPLDLLAQSDHRGGFRLIEAKARAIQTLGHRLRLTETDAALLRHPEIVKAEAAVLLSDSHQPALVAYILPVRGVELDLVQLRRSLLATLPAYLVPHEFILVDSLPRTLDGRLDLSRLSRERSATRTSAPTPALPQSAEGADDAGFRLRRIWAEVLGLHQFDEHCSFFELGGTSLLLVRLFTRINKEFGTSLPITTIFDASTASRLAEHLRRQTEVRPIVAVQTGGPRQPLFMVHSYLLYQGLSQALGEDQPFYGLRELESDNGLSVEQRVTRYIREMRSVQPHGPYNIAGWCAAGPLTVEVARQLIAEGEELASVVLFDSWLPGYLAEVERQRSHAWVPNLSKLRSKVQYHLAQLQNLPPAGKLAHVRNAIRRIAREARDGYCVRHWSTLKSLADRFHMPLPQFMYNTSLQTFAALREYREQSSPLSLTLIRASDSRDVAGASISCGWERVAEQGVQVLWAPGDHESMFVGKNLRATAALFGNCLSGAAADVRTMAPERPIFSIQTETMVEAGSV